MNPNLFVLCPHGRRSAHETEWVHDPPGSFFKSGEWCPGGRPATLEDFGGEKVWWCAYSGVGNAPGMESGTPNGCKPYWASGEWPLVAKEPSGYQGPEIATTYQKAHVEQYGCGWRLVIPISKESVQAANVPGIT